MNKFDSIISDLCEANGYPNQPNTNQQNTNNTQQNTNNNQQQNANTNQQNTNQQQSPNNNQQQQNVNNAQQQKIDLQKLMTDFNNNTLSIKNIKDFEKYGLKAS